MSALVGAVETAPVSSLHAVGSANPDDFAVPDGREEEWRFTPLRRLRGLHKDAPFTGAVTVTVEAAPEVTVDKLDLSERGRLAPSVVPFLPMDRVSARAYAAAVSATVITVPKEAVASAPTYVRVTGSGHRMPRPPGTSSSTCSPTGGRPWSSTRPGPPPTPTTSRSTSPTAATSPSSPSPTGPATRCRSRTTSPPSAGTRTSRTSRSPSAAPWSGSRRPSGTPAPAATPSCTASRSPTPGQHLEHRLFVDHDTPNCRSRVRYKGALSGDGARTVWIGDVLIRPEATGTDTYEYNRNLVLTDGAHADSVPNLEILTGEVVGAGHASTNGRLDDEHLFYLQARGIPFEEARRLVIRGFFGELIARIGVPEL